MDDAKRYLDVIAKLMNEEENEASLLEAKYNQLYDYIHEDLADGLDQGSYTANSDIIRKLDELLKKYRIFNAIPELAEKHLFVVRGDSYYIEKIIMSKVLPNCSWIKHNNNVPIIIVNGQKSNSGLWVLTYMNKLVHINRNEYFCITKELFKQNIEIRKLVKGFLVYAPYKYEELNFMLVPGYTEDNNDICEGLMGNGLKEYLLIDPDKKWERSSNRTLLGERFLLCQDKSALIKTNSLLYDRFESFEYDDIYNLLNQQNTKVINFNIESQMLEILMDAQIYYHDSIKRVTGLIERLTKDSFMLNDVKVKGQVSEYRKKAVDSKKDLERGKNTLTELMNNIVCLTSEYERLFSDALMHDLGEGIDANDYISTLLCVFFKSIRAENYNEAKKCVFRLKRANYPFIEIFDEYLNVKKGGEISSKCKSILLEVLEPSWEIAKIKIDLSNQLKLNYKDLKDLVRYVDGHYDLGKEYFFLAKREIDEKNYLSAKFYLDKALEYDYPKAGEELIKLAQKDDSVGVDIEELAENLVPEANFIVGSENVIAHPRKGLTNLKMAASNEHYGAIKMVAEMLFSDCREITWQEMEKETNKQKICNVIRLYGYLRKVSNSEDDKPLFELRLGLMYLKLNDYLRAYEYLKNLKDFEAQYQCAKMYQYGNGVAKDLKQALKHYSNCAPSYRDSKSQIAKIKELLNTDTSGTSHIKSYSADKTYKAESTTTSSSSSFCFITTAACLALNESKDCQQLNVLRWFRDTHILAKDRMGKSLVEEYYRIGPEIIKCIDRDWNPKALYLELWEDYIAPSCQLINEQKWDEAKWLYINMVKTLCETYSIRVVDTISEHYGINMEKNDGQRSKKSKNP
ncbi:CFI-box-CTERM domain-containing protein [Butyrivibrio sp. VCB2001]|uniref:CFI-box-CTERM domain-containing protein n=1 Tax=Butyrivibrio sp. VCB2001 TaxID=1280667 RepID=UPI0003F79ACF|nr:CFI-box-CTERM domain-containing protein [Butyrivibrio sp. VCB2001]